MPRAGPEPSSRGNIEDCSILESFPRCFEQQPLLRIHRGCLARRETEEEWVELLDAIEEGAPLAVAALRLKVVEGDLRFVARLDYA